MEISWNQIIHLNSLNFGDIWIYAEPTNKGTLGKTISGHYCAKSKQGRIRPCSEKLHLIFCTDRFAPHFWDPRQNFCSKAAVHIKEESETPTSIFFKVYTFLFTSDMWTVDLHEANDLKWWTKPSSTSKARSLSEAVCPFPSLYVFFSAYDQETQWSLPQPCLHKHFKDLKLYKVQYPACLKE